jgi:hypothetical protein
MAGMVARTNRGQGMVTRSAAYLQFIESMQMDYMKWHDGTPYDLDCLASVSPEELAELEALLIERKDADWRDAEALAKINSPAAILALRDSMNGPDREVRIRAAELLHGNGLIDSLDAVIIDGLRFGKLGKGFAQAIELAAAHPSEAVKATLLQGAFCSSDAAVGFAAALLVAYGKASKVYDQSQQAVFSRFATKDPRARRQAFDDLCVILGVNGSRVTGGSCPPGHYQMSEDD